MASSIWMPFPWRCLKIWINWGLYIKQRKYSTNFFFNRRAWKLNIATTKCVINYNLETTLYTSHCLALGDIHQYECEALSTLRHSYLGSFSLDPEEVRSLSLGEIWNFIKEMWLPWLQLQSKEHKGPVKGLGALGPKGLEPIIFLFLTQNLNLLISLNLFGSK